MTMAIGAHTLPYVDYPIERAFDGISGAGLEVAGLYPRDVNGPLFSARPVASELRTVRNAAERSGLQLVSMFARENATMRPEVLEVDLHTCAELQIPYLLAAGPWPLIEESRRPEMEWYAAVEQFLATLAEGAAVAESTGVTVVLKPHRGATATGADIVDVLGRVGSSAVAACWDAGNIRFYEGLDSEDDLEKSGVATFVRSVSIKDHRGAQGEAVFPTPGSGDVDHPRMLRTLSASGFTGPLLIERVDQPDLDATDQALAAGSQYLQSVLADLDERTVV